MESADVVVVGAGIVGAACAFELAGAGLEVCVVDRGAVASGTTGAGEGNILVSDKPPGPELALAQLSAARWQELGEELDDDVELELKGGVVCASTTAGLDALRELGVAQRAAGVQVRDLTPEGAFALEPGLSREIAGAAHYAGDMQVQPMRAAAALLRAARRRGTRVLLEREVTAIRDGVIATSGGDIRAPAVVNAAGPWAGALAELAGGSLPIAPRRGVILVTEPLPPTVFHKVFAAEYVGDVGSSEAALQVSAVVEGTRGGTILIGASRELAGFDREVPAEVLRRLAAAALELFPVLARVRVMRTYTGFRPFSPDHLPAIGADPRVEGLWHACGHEGAGIGLAPATGRLLAALMTGARPPLDPAPFDPARFAAVPA